MTATTPDIRIARVYDADDDTKAGVRLLVDRIWPRGIRKADLQPDAWLRDIAPSTALRKWFGHDPAKWEEFRRLYAAELDARPEAVEAALDWCRRGPVTLLYGASDREHNQAVLLRDYLRDRLGRD
ncbi:DUF488 domain-containing protein [Paracoccus marinaquae]|uniref:DUF488 family protein n=1 Tax=Paracoccus marinaquae TaxID=2841926 RepID=A0ABS6AGB4_9RHOB|nr:DUF488 family protein [Paracoccus marinaquae]MBU3029553.1 DUF488 family protein [Paracoccus marinaquae]